MQERFYSDIELLDRLRSDDTVCFEELYHRHWRMVYFYALKKLHSREDARQVVSAVFSEVWNERYQIPVEFSLPILLYQKVRVAVVQQLHAQLGEVSQTEWIEGYVLPYFGGERPELSDSVVSYEVPEAHMEQFGPLFHQGDHALSRQGWMQVLRMSALRWNKPWALLGRNH
jgi:DNA-directed RNA polymerase specialized sigma24 family protein